MRKIQRILHSFWAGDPMPSEYFLWGARLRAMNPSCRFMHWNEQNIYQLGLAWDDLLRIYTDMASISNVVRLHAVHKHGGIWLDADFEPVKPLDILFEWGDAVCEQEDGRLCQAYFQAVAGSPWISWQMKAIRSAAGLGASAGVDVMTAAPRENVTILPRELMYSYWHDTPEDKRKVSPEALMVHKWAKSWVKP